ncbi:MAG: hypothetical protein M1592_03685 [Candidatus Thermoplasmatota archaeon]|nr:hypothetical protein [Candidatus Thermoplasmatota archaeon]
MKTASGEIDPADYFRPVRIDGRTKWECIYCFKVLTRSSRGKHLKGKHADEIGYVPDSYSPPDPEKIREVWINWYESGMHRVDLRARINESLSRITRSAVEKEIRRIVEE